MKGRNKVVMLAVVTALSLGVSGLASGHDNKSPGHSDDSHGISATSGHQDNGGDHTNKREGSQTDDTGPQGPIGPQGATGPQGPQGEPGVVDYSKVDHQISAGDTKTLKSANSYTNQQTAKRDIDQDAEMATAQGNAESQAQIDANTAQGNAETYTNQQMQVGNAATLQKANRYAARIAGQDASTAQQEAQNFAASGIAAALAMPSDPVLRPGSAYVGVEAASYYGQQAVGVKGTYQIDRHWNADVGVSSGTGYYGHIAVAAGVGYEFGVN